VDVWINSTNPPCNIMKATDAKSGANIPITIPSTFSGNNGKGFFSLPAGGIAILGRNDGNILINGSITFNAIPICPCGGSNQPPCPVVPGANLPTKLINGVNQFEYSLNSTFESIDIGCGNGENGRIAAKLQGGSPVWANNVTHQPVPMIQSNQIDILRHRDDNCQEVGVFPFSITDCVTNPNPPCGAPICPLRGVRTCQLDRKGEGGTVSVYIQSTD
ncbi:MAG TPA: hypothetical protein V6C72_08135, partial [Chroococcales cyanobacterium]